MNSKKHCPNKGVYLFRLLAKHIYRGIIITVLRLKYALFGIEAINQFLSKEHKGVDYILRSFGATVKENAIIPGPLLIINADRNYRNLSIGTHSHIGKNVLLDLVDKVWIGDETVISVGSMLFTHQDAGDRPVRAMISEKRCPLAIGNNSYIGARSVILCGCDIGDFSVVAAGSVIASPTKDFSLVAGVPAVLKKDLKHGPTSK